MLGGNALVIGDVAETVSNVFVMEEFLACSLKRIGREINNGDLIALGMLAQNNCNALRCIEIQLEKEVTDETERIWEPGVDQVTPATP